MRAVISHGFDQIPAAPHLVTIGNFDGVHRGHQYLLAMLTERARQQGARSLVLTFDPLPAEVLYPERAPKRLTTIGERLALISDLGVDTIAVLPFTREFASWPPSEFIERLVESTHPLEIIVGADFRFGHNRAGTPELLAEAGERANFSMRVLDRIGGEDISSTRIRQLIQAGDVEGAAELLARPYQLTGSVHHGLKRGRVLGFPTANLAIDERLAVPADGIYAAYATIDDGPTVLDALVYIGTRPTFDDTERIVEVYLLDFAADLYGQTISIHFLAQIRGDRAFASAEALIDQMKRDELDGRRILDAAASTGTKREVVRRLVAEGAERADH